MLGRKMLSGYHNVGQNNEAITIMLGRMMFSYYHSVGQNDDKRLQ